MARLLRLILLTISLTTIHAWGSDSLSYSGRLVNSNGSPVTGPVNLKFDLAYTNDLSIILCSKSATGVDLVNGVFHVKLAFDCPSSSLNKVLEETPVGNSIAIRVTDQTPTTPKVYSFQALHSIPFSIMANFAKQLSQMGATNGQVLTWNGTQWSPADPAGTMGGVTTINGEQGLSAVKVDETVTIGILDGGVTSQKLNQMGATSGQVLKWNGTSWAPGNDVDTDTGLTTEVDPTVRAFARNDVTGITPEICAAHQALRYVSVDNSLRCFDIVLSDADIQAASVADAINDSETAIAPSQNAVFDALAGKQNTITNTSDITMKTLRLMTDGSTWIGLRAPTTSGNLYFTLPATDGTPNQVLKTDGAGNLGWVNASVGTITGITTSAPLSGSGTSGSVNISLSTGGISNTHIAAGAGIEWSKLSKTGAVAADVGAVPTTRNVSTGTGLLGGGNLTADRTLSVDVGTTAGKIVQVDGSNKLPAIDGSQLTNLVWSQILTATLPTLIAGTGLTTTGSLATTQSFAVDVGTTAGKIVQLETGGKLPAVDGSQLTNLGTNLGKWSDATGGIHYSSGNVGIGTNAPSVPFEVKSNAGAGLNNIFKITSSNGDSYFSIFDNAGSDTVFAPAYLGYAGMTETSALQFIGGVDAANDVAGLPLLTFQGRRGATSGSAITTRDIMSVNNFSTTLMRIKANGYVGIGTSTPLSNLEVFSGVDAGVDDDDDGIVISNFQPSLYFKDRTTGDPDDVRIRVDQGDLSFERSADFFTSSPVFESSMMIKANGRVGIGTINPERSLDIAGGDIRSFKNEGYNVIESRTASDANYSPHFILRRSRGTVETPSYVQNGDTMGLLTFRNHIASQGASIASYATEAHASGAWGANLAFFTIPNGGTTTAERMRIDQAGNVGIGTATPSSKLHVSSSAANTQIRVEAASTGAQAEYYSVANGTAWVIGTGAGSPGSTNLGFYNSGSKMVLTPTGSLGIGTTTPSSKFDLRGGDAFIEGRAYVYSNSAWGSVTPSISLAIGDNDTGLNWVSDGVLQLYNNNQPVIHMALGAVGVGTTTPAHKLDVNGNIRTAGCLYYNGGSLGTCASDERLKTDLRTFDLGLNEILGINPVYFKYNGLGALPTDGGEQLGVIAQELEKSAPSLVVKRKVRLHADDQKDTEIKAVDYGAFTYVLINSVKEIYGMVQELFSHNEEVNREIASLKEENQEMKAYICHKDPEAPFCKKRP